MTDHEIHVGHDHQHGPGCGHTAVRHAGHVDYLHDGCLHHPHDDHVDEHRLDVNGANPDGHTDAAAGHDPDHAHASGCGHEAVPHGGHTDYLVGDRLHRPHDDHCDDHGAVEVVQAA